VRDHCVDELVASKQVTNIAQVTFAWVVATQFEDRKKIGNLIKVIQTEPDSIINKKQFEMAGGSHTLASILEARKNDPENPNFQSMQCWIFAKFQYETDEDELRKFQLASILKTLLSICC